MDATSKTAISDTDTTTPTATTKRKRAPKVAASKRQPIEKVADADAPICNVSVSRADLEKALATLRFTADSKSTMPLLANVLMRHHTPHAIALTATDLNVYTTAIVPARVYSDKECTFNARAALDVVRSMPDGDILLTRDAASGLEIAGGRASMVVDTIPARDFPKIPSIDEASWVDSDGEVFADMLTRVEFATSQDQTRFHLCGVMIESDRTHTRMVTTDGHRLATARRALPFPDTRGVIIADKGVAELRRVIDKGPIRIALDRTYLHVRQGNVTITSKLINAQYPTWRNVVPEARILVTVGREDLIAACKRAKVALQGAHGTTGMGLEIEASTMIVRTSKGDGIRAMREALDCDASKPAMWGCNPQYLIEALARINGERVVVSLDSDLDPAMLRSVDDAAMRPVMEAEFLVITMPMRV